MDAFDRACLEIGSEEGRLPTGTTVAKPRGHVAGYALHSETLAVLAVVLPTGGHPAVAVDPGVLEPGPADDAGAAGLPDGMPVRHRKGGIYHRICDLDTPGGPCVLYADSERLWVRPREMFEDGRFTPVEDPRPVTRPQDLHDPGGKVRLRLADDVTGGAEFSACGRYRRLLSRDWTPDGVAPRTILWIGMNPSTADASVSDPTCGREKTFSEDWGYTLYLKANMLDWRATNPRDLPPDPRVAASPENLPAILSAAAGAEMVVLGYGKLHKRYHGIVDETIAALRAAGTDLRCLARNADGSARHPLYLRKDLRPVPF